MRLSSAQTYDALAVNAQRVVLNWTLHCASSATEWGTGHKGDLRGRPHYELTNNNINGEHI